MNWRVKLAVKIASGKVPAIKNVLKRAGYFRHGKMESGEYAIRTFNRHLSRLHLPLSESGSGTGTGTGTGAAAVSGGTFAARVQGGTCLEIGPGESLITMILARAAGFDSTVLVDYGSQIGQDMRPYVEMAVRLRESGFSVPEVTPKDRIEDVMAKYHARYLTGGVESMRTLEKGSIDFSFSQAVFEHIPKAQVPEYLRLLRHVGAPAGFSSHRVDLKDHLGGSINQLRFAEADWENEGVYNSGVYTNRIRFSGWQNLFAAAGIAFRIVERNRFPAPPVPRNRLAEEFRLLDEDDLATYGFDVLFRWDP